MEALADAPAAIQDLKRRVQGAGVALLSRNGSVVDADLPSSASSETYSILCATVLGAAVTAHAELGRAPPQNVVIDGSGTRSLIFPVGEQELLAVVAEEQAEPANAIELVLSFVRLLAARPR